MNFKKVANPLDKELTLRFEGESYTIGAKTSKEFLKNVAEQWLFIYSFMTVDDSKEVKETSVDAKEVEVKVKKK